MGKKLIALLALTALLVTAALAAAGTAGDPFITLSWLTGAYYKEAETAMLERAQEGTAELAQAAFDKLEALTEDYRAQASLERSFAAGFQRMTLAGGSRLELTTGTQLLYEGGLTQLSFAGGALVDVTDGSQVPAGGSLTAGHRYVAAENTVCSLSVLSDAAYLSLQGGYELESAGDPATPFTDVTGGDWYIDSVRFVYENSLLTGVTTTTFQADVDMNRAMLATVLSRMAGVTGDVPSAGFTDVAQGDWFANAVNWAASAGVVTGDGAGLFEPMSSVTREEMVTMLYRYAKGYLGLELSPGGDLSAFTDAGDVSDWAAEAFSWAVDSGIITGMTTTTLVPQDTATRAQVATILMRFTSLLQESA